MHQKQTEIEKQPLPTMPVLGKPPLPFAGIPRPAGDTVALPRASCSICRQSFALEVEAQWNRPPQEMELEGRRFQGIREDSVLCPECVSDMEVAGAERMYWALSHDM